MLEYVRIAGALMVAAVMLPGASYASDTIRVLAEGSTTERFSLNLSVPKGYCALDASHAVDASVIRYWQQSRPAGQQLVKAAVECAQLDAWRRPPLLLVDFTQYQVVYRWDYEGMRYDQRIALPALACQITRQQTAQPVGEPQAALEKRLAATLSTLKVGESKLLGVIEEEAAACYLVVVAQAQTSTGKPASVLHLRATVAIKGRVLEFYQIAHTAGGKELAALHRSADALKRAVNANMKDNE